MRSRAEGTALRDEEFAHMRWRGGRPRHVIFAGARSSAVPFDQRQVIAVGKQPLCLGL